MSEPLGGRPLRTAGRPGRRNGPGGRPVPVALGATTTGLWAAVVSLAPVAALVLTGWVFGGSAAQPDGGSAGTPGATDGLRFAGSAWLLAHGVPLTTSAGRIGLAPLAVSLLAAWQLARAGSSTARAAGATGVSGAARAAFAVAGVYGVVGMVVALLCGTPTVAASPLLAGALTGLVALLAAGIGAGVQTGGWAQVAAALPAPVRRGVAAGALAAVLVIGGGSLLVAGSLVASWGEAGALYRSYGPGLAPLLGLTALCLVYAPNAAVWAAAYACGAGVSLGTDTSVSPWSAEAGPVPAFPLLAALPAGSPPALAGLVLAVPLLAGVLAGAVAARGDGPGPAGGSGGPAVGRALVAGLCAGVLLGFAALAASGSLGDGRLAVVGPSAWRVAAAVAVEVAAGALAGAAVWRGLEWAAGRLFGPAMTMPDREPDIEPDREPDREPDAGDSGGADGRRAGGRPHGTGGHPRG
jgi:hypothetical protein